MNANDFWAWYRGFEPLPHGFVGQFLVCLKFLKTR